MVNKIFLPALLLMVLAAAASAQSTHLAWDQHGIAFKTPADFKIQTSTADQFVAGNSGLQMTVSPITTRPMSEDQLTEGGMYLAYQAGYKKLTQPQYVDTDTFAGSWVESTKDGQSAIIMALLNKKTRANLFLVVNYTAATRGDAVKMVQEFSATK